MVNASSIRGRIAWRRSGTYAATKFALEALSGTLSLELRPWGVAVSMVEPGYVKSNIDAALLERPPWGSVTPWRGPAACRRVS